MPKTSTGKIMRRELKTLDVRDRGRNRDLVEHRVLGQLSQPSIKLDQSYEALDSYAILPTISFATSLLGYVTMELREIGANWVEGEQFFDRETEFKMLAERSDPGVGFPKARIDGVDLYLTSFGPALDQFSRHWPLQLGAPSPIPTASGQVQ